MKEQNMRTTNELIEVMREKAVGAVAAAIVVGFEHKTEFVWANVPDPLGDLNALVKGGGAPVAVCRMEKLNGTLNYCLYLFEEFENEVWVHRYLDALGKGIIEELAQTVGGGVGGIKRNRLDLN